ncbi:hypothetical protein ABFX02_14G005100 [Erythranthe guttata]
MGAQDKPPNAGYSRQFVKVYRLIEDGKWDDQGTGLVTVDYLERSEDLGLFVVDEGNNETLLLHRISSDDIYHKQEETIISWRDPDFSTELALSFKEAAGCTYIWDRICSVQRNMRFGSLTDDTCNNVNSELRELPPVELSTLPLILKTVVESGVTDQLRVTELILHDQDFFQKLMELFRLCEDLENVNGLHMIYKIIRGIILLNSPQIFEKIFGDDLIMDIIGCLEYDPELTRIHHRNYVKEHLVYKEVIPIKDHVVLSKIHQTFRVGYLKDVILPRALDEAVVANLNSIIQSNNATVVSLLRDNNTFIKELFARLKLPDTSIESKRTLVCFLHEFCTLSKSLQMVHQLRLFRDLVNEGILHIIADILLSEDKKLVLTVTDILFLFLKQDPISFRSNENWQDGVLFGLLAKNMLTDFGDDMHCQILEIICSLLDSCTPGPQREILVEIFYRKHFGELIDAIVSSCPPNGDGQIGLKSLSSNAGFMNQIRVKPEILLNISDLLCFCVMHHPHRIKCNFLLNNVIDKVLYLTRRREKYLVVAAVRFVRMLVSRGDEHLMNHFVKNNLLKPIVDAFVANGDRYNLLNSVVLELFEYIRKENLKTLLRYLVDTFWDQLARFENLSSIQALKVKYEQSLESAGATSTSTLLDQRKRIDARALEKEEEDYFNEDRIWVLVSDEEDSALAHNKPSTKRGQNQQPVLTNGSSPNDPSPRPAKLVDYVDDEDYTPPPKKTADSSVEDDDFPLKRKLISKEEPEPKRLKQQLPKGGLKPREGVFAAFCSTLSQGVIPSKKAVTIAFNINQSDPNKKVTPNIENTENEKCTDKEEASPPTMSCSNESGGDSRQEGDGCPLLPPNSSPEMVLNGP